MFTEQNIAIIVVALVFVCLFTICVYNLGELRGISITRDLANKEGKEQLLNDLIDVYNTELRKIRQSRIPVPDFLKNLAEFIDSQERRLYGKDSKTFITDPEGTVVNYRDLADCWMNFENDEEDE